jgi:hypothetical protein
MDVARCEVYELLPVVCHTEFVYGQHEIVSEKPNFRNPQGHPAENLLKHE